MLINISTINNSGCALLEQRHRRPGAAAGLAHGGELEPLHVGVAVGTKAHIVARHQDVVPPFGVQDPRVARGNDLPAGCFAAGGMRYELTLMSL